MTRRRMIAGAPRRWRGRAMLRGETGLGQPRRRAPRRRSPVRRPAPPAEPGSDYTPVITPNGVSAAVEDRRRREGVPPRRRGGRPRVRARPAGQVLGLQRPQSTARRSRPSRATASASTSPTACPRRPASTGTACSLPNGMDGVGGPDPEGRSSRARRSSTSSRSASTARTCTTRTTTR